MTTEGMIEKAARLHDDGRVVFLPAKYTARVKGDTGMHTVVAFHDGVRCDCPAGQYGKCSHALACMLAWAQEKESA